METLLFIGACTAIIISLLYHKISLKVSLGILSAILVGSTIFDYIDVFTLVIMLIITAGIYILFGKKNIRQKYYTLPILKKIKKSLPTISKTEETAINAGTVWFDKELFSGEPQWKKLSELSITKFTKEEQDFLDGPVEELCKMIDDWEIVTNRNLPKKIWNHLFKYRFFGMVIKKEYGGHGFSALAHSEVIAKIGGKSISVATTVAVPNSLGPGELLQHYGTREQKDYYLPRLAAGQEIPCFALTNPYAGSDAVSIPDKGIVCYGKFKGKKTLGILLNWDKRYITLAPIATVLGLAFKLYDPENLIGDKTELGITCALIPTNLPGITIGERHYPLSAAFLNGPTSGKDVFIPIDYIIGGVKMAGEGWRMLVECLSAGRSTSIPSISTGGMKAAIAASSAYSRIRAQFKQPICNFEGIQEAIGRIAANAYISEAARIVTNSAIDNGERPSVIGAILKYHISEMGRQTACDTIDLHGGKGIIQGPNNYIAQGYMSAPISITVEGANILTRSLIIFGQGALRCHPYLLDEIKLAQSENIKLALPEFDAILAKHTQHLLSSAAKAFTSYITNGLLIRSKNNKNTTKRYYQLLTWASSSFNFVADISMLLLGGKLKVKERLSARLGDMLSMLYLSSCCLKKFEHDGALDEDKLFLDYSVKLLMNKFWQALIELIANFPNKPTAIVLKVLTIPFGNPVKKPADKMDKEITAMLTSQSSARDRLIKGVFLNDIDSNPLAKLEYTLRQVIAIEPIEKRLKQALKDNLIYGETLAEQIDSAIKISLLTENDAIMLQKTYKLIDEIISVDQFSEKLTKKSMLASKESNSVVS